MGAFQCIVIRRQDKPGFNRPHSFGFIEVKEMEQQLGITDFKGIGRLFEFVLVENITIGYAVCPFQIIYVVYALDIHGKAFHAVCDFR